MLPRCWQGCFRLDSRSTWTPWRWCMRNSWLALLLFPTFLVATWATAQDYKIAQPGYTFAFPRDYFNHEDYQTEWWYYTGNVKSADGHRFGFELTFFRQGVSRAESGRRGLAHALWI